MRKVLEKHQWDPALGRKILQTYQQIRPLDREEMENLRIRFSYPEKYWKLANHYYTHNKAWIPEKNLEKTGEIKGTERKMEKLCGKRFCGLRNFRICLTNHRKHGINNCRPQWR